MILFFETKISSNFKHVFLHFYHTGIGEYLCGANVLKAHALAYHSYKNSFYDRFKGQIGITLSSRFFYSETNDTNLVDRAMQFYVCTTKKTIE